MRRVFLILLFLVVLVASTRLFSPSAPAMAASASDANIPGWTITFDDEFDNPSLDKSNYQGYWGKIGASWWNGDDNLFIQDGLLRLKLDQQDVYQNGTTYHYTAGGFNQITRQTYGRWVIRARFPQGAGTQSYISLWRQDFQWPPEIDFAEVVGIRPSENIFSLHYSEGGQNLWDGFKLEDIDFTGDFHEYTLIVEPGKLTWLVDGVETYTTTPKFDPFPMELAVGDLVDSCGSFAGCPDENTTFPQYLDIDYIRIYTQN